MDEEETFSEKHSQHLLINEGQMRAEIAVLNFEPLSAVASYSQTDASECGGGKNSEGKEHFKRNFLMNEHNHVNLKWKCEEFNFISKNELLDSWNLFLTPFFPHNFTIEIFYDSIM